MSTRDSYPAGVPCWVETLQADTRAAAAFYEGLMGWSFAGSEDPGEELFPPPREEIKPA